jgi:hypothetical protein
MIRSVPAPPLCRGTGPLLPDRSMNDTARSTPQTQIQPGVSYGRLAPVDTAIVQILTLLAEDPAYADLRLKHVAQIVRVIRSGAYFAAVEAGVCCGVILFVRVPGAVARRCIAENRLPELSELHETGDSLCMTAVTGRQVKALAREFARCHAGSIILFERHIHDGAPADSRLGWVDRTGRIRGTALDD